MASKTRQGRTARIKKAGQGVIEYAGALVIAALFIAVVLTTLPEGMYEFFVDIQESILSFFVGEIDNIGAEEEPA